MQRKNAEQKMEAMEDLRETNPSELMAIDGGRMKIPGKNYRLPLVNALGDPITVYVDGFRVGN